MIQGGQCNLEIKSINAQNVEVLLELTQVNVIGWSMQVGDQTNFNAQNVVVLLELQKLNVKGW